MESISFQPFPTEIYATIIANIRSRRDLFSLLLTSRIISLEAERVLYSTIFPCNSTVLLSHLANCKRVAKHVKIFGLIYLGEKDDYDLVCGAFRNMTNLESLSITQGVNCSLWPLMSFLISEAKISLRALATNSSNLDGVRLFLRSQSELRSLVWVPIPGCSFPPNFFLPSDLPKLTTLTGSLDLALALLPGRDIKRLRANGIDSYKGQFPSIETFDHPLGPGNQAHLTFPNLRYIRMCLFSNKPYKPALTYSRFPRLESVKFEVHKISITSPLWKNLASEILNSNPSLKIVELFARTGKTDEMEQASIVRFQAQRTPFSPTIVVTRTEFIDDYLLHCHNWRHWS